MPTEASAARSENMARIRGAHTEPERLLRLALREAGFRGYRLNARTPAGRADVVWASKRWAIFVDGCFWHGCPEHYVMPRSNVAFWQRKLRENVSRDRAQTLKLRANDWVVVRLWEHQVRIDPGKAAARTILALTSSRTYLGSLSRVISVEFIDETIERRGLTTLRTCDAKSRFILRHRSTHKAGIRRSLVLGGS